MDWYYLIPAKAVPLGEIEEYIAFKAILCEFALKVRNNFLVRKCLFCLCRRVYGFHCRRMRIIGSDEQGQALHIFVHGLGHSLAVGNGLQVSGLFIDMFFPLVLSVLCMPIRAWYRFFDFYMVK